MAVPGVKKEDLKLELGADVLTTSSTMENKHEEKDAAFSRKEFSYHSFSRLFSLPETVKSERIAANYKDGILSISLSPKGEEKAEGKFEIAVS